MAIAGLDMGPQVSAFGLACSVTLPDAERIRGRWFPDSSRLCLHFLPVSGFESCCESLNLALDVVQSGGSGSLIFAF